MEIIEIDHVGPFEPITPSGHSYILSVIDHFTRKRWYLPATGCTAEETYDILCKSVCTAFDFPTKILTDMGSAFDSELSSLFAKLLNIEHQFALAREHDTVGSVERSNRTCEDMVRKFIDKLKRNDWDKFLHFLSYAENKAISRSHGFSPDYLMFGRQQINLLSDSDSSVQLNHNQFLRNLEKAWTLANQVLSEYRSAMEKQRLRELGRRKPLQFKAGDYVWLSMPMNAKVKGISGKLQDRAVGPYGVEKILPNGNVQISITPTRSEIVKSCRLRLSNIKPILDADSILSHYTEVIIIPKPSPPPPVNSEVEKEHKGEYNIESIVGKRITVHWPSFKEWRRGTVIGYTVSKSKSLIYYDQRTPDCDWREDYYMDPLFTTGTSQTVVNWKLLVPAEVPSKKSQQPLRRSTRAK
jgi:hypothetical protein